MTILLDSEKVTRQHPSVKNQLRYQIKRQNNASSNNVMQSVNKSINPFLIPMDHKKQMMGMSNQSLMPPQVNSDTDILSIIR